MINIKHPNIDGILTVSKNAFKSIYEFNGYKEINGAKKSIEIKPEPKEAIIKPEVKLEAKEK